MTYSNFHTHTDFSDGAHSVEENIRSALDLSMEALGFSDHSYTPCDESYCMMPDAYARYAACVRQMQEKYAGQIPIYLGLELDENSPAPEIDLDYVIASVHYINHKGVCYPIDHSPVQQQDCIREVFGGSVLDFARCYYDLLTAHVEKTRPTIVGHFDVITKFSLLPMDSEEYLCIASEALKKAVKICPYVEVNTGAISRGWRQEPYPQKELLEVLCKAGGRPVLSSDSHKKENLIFWFDRAEELLRRAGFRERWTLESGQMKARSL